MRAPEQGDEPKEERERAHRRGEPEACARSLRELSAPIKISNALEVRGARDDGSPIAPRDARIHGGGWVSFRLSKSQKMPDLVGEDGCEIIARWVARCANLLFAVDEDVCVEDFARPRIKTCDRDGEEVLLIGPRPEEINTIGGRASPVTGLIFCHA